MDTKILSIQFSFFGDFKDLNPSNPDQVIKLLEMLKGDDFIPSTFGEIPINNNQISFTNRFSFTNKHGAVINIGSERTDIVFNLVEDGKYKEMDIDELNEISIEYINNILNTFPRIINRVSLIVNKLYNDEISKKLEKVFKKNVLLDYYKSNEPEEWNERLLFKLQDDFPVAINVGININKTPGMLINNNQETDITGVMTLYDINSSIAPYTNYSIDDIKHFYELAKKEYNKIDDNIKEL